MAPVEVAGKILSEFGFLQDCKVDGGGEFRGYFHCINDELVHDCYKEKIKKGYQYVINIIYSGPKKKDTLFTYEPAYSYAYVRYGVEKYESCLKFRDAICEFCRKNKIKTKTFEKYDSINKVERHVIESLKKLSSIGFANKKSYKNTNVISKLVKKSYDSYFDKWYGPLENGYGTILNCVFKFVKDKCICEDFHEYSWTSRSTKYEGRKTMAKGYKDLLLRFLKFAKFQREDLNIWVKIFRRKAKIRLSTRDYKHEFLVNHKNEGADLTNLLKGVNMFLKKYRPTDKRSLKTLQIFRGQTDCVWHITDREQKQLCKILHRYWPAYVGQHICSVTSGKHSSKEIAKDVWHGLIYGYREKL